MGEADNNQNVQEQDLNQLLKVRREKLAVLQEGGKNPFEITKYDASHHSAEIKEKFESLESVFNDNDYVSQIELLLAEYIGNL